MRTRRIITGTLTVAAILGGLLTATPANASVEIHLHETYKGSVYLTTDGTVPYGHAETGSAPGRDIYLLDLQEVYYDPNGLCGVNGCPVYEFVLLSQYCIGSNNSGSTVEVRDCGSTYTYWALQHPYPFIDDLLINVGQSNYWQADVVMGGTGTTGQDIYTCFYGGCPSGTYAQWSD